MSRSPFLHVEAAARTRLVDGVELAVAYAGDTVAEISTLQSGAAVVDRSHRGRLRVSGGDRVAFLHGQSSADVKRLRPGRGTLATFLNGKGKMRGFGMIHAEPDALYISCDGGAASVVRSHLESFVIMDDVTIADCVPEVAQLAVVGPLAAARLGEALGLPDLASLTASDHLRRVAERHEVWVARDASLEEPTFEVVVARGLADWLWQRLRDHMPAVGFDAVEALRVASGFPRWGIDAGDDGFPLEVGLAAAIDYDKGCFTGYEVMARIRTYGHVNRHLVGLVLTLSGIAAGDAVEWEGKTVGRVTSVADVDGQTLALAMLSTATSAPGTCVEVAAKGGPVSARVRPLAKAPLAG